MEQQRKGGAKLETKGGAKRKAVPVAATLSTSTRALHEIQTWSSFGKVSRNNMCSNHEVIPDLKSKEKSTARESSCLRCHGDDVHVLLRGSDTYCKTCFIQDAYHKFRATLGKARAVKPGDTILLGYSGGLASGSMLAMVKESMKDNTQHRKLVVVPSVLHIDEGCLLGRSPEECLKNTQELASHVSGLGFDFYAIGLEYGLLSSKDFPDLPLFTPDAALPSSPEQETELRNILSSTTNLTASEELQTRLRNKILTETAQKLGISKVFVASTGSRLAAHLLISVSQGRGGQIPQEMGFCDERHDDVRVLRPLREFTDREIAYFSHFLSVPSLLSSTLTSKAPSNASIGKQIDGFVANLEHNFPSTTYTLFRTGDKIAAHKGNGKESTDFCLLCKSTLEVTATSCSAQQARLFSQLVSALGPEGIRAKEAEFLQMNEKQLLQQLFAMQAPPSQGCGSSSSCSPTTQPEQNRNSQELKKYLCYSCKTTLEDVKQIPSFLLNTAQYAMEHERRERMREQIQDFLL